MKLIMNYLFACFQLQIVKEKTLKLTMSIFVCLIRIDLDVDSNEKKHKSIYK